MQIKKYLFIPALIFSVNTYAQTVQLSLKNGQKYELTSVTKVSSVASVMGQDMESTANTTQTEVFEVKNSMPAQTDLTTTITHMVMNSSAMGQEINFDSDKKDNTGPASEEMMKLINKPASMTIDGKGKILKEDKSDNDADASFTGSNMQPRALFYHGPVIGRSLREGDTWQDSTVQKSDKMNTVIGGIYTVKKIENGIATIVFNGTSTMKGSMEQMGQAMDMNSSSKVTGETRLNTSTGIIIDSINNTDGSMTIEAGGMSIPVTIKSTTTTAVKML